MKKIDSHRQGDVTLFPVSTAFKAPLAKDGKAVLAHGEATGHMHVLEGKRVRYTTDAEVIAALEKELVAKGIYQAGAETIAGAVIVEGEAELWHGNADKSGPDHGAQTIGRLGPRYAVIRKREYHPAEIRRVMD